MSRQFSYHIQDHHCWTGQLTNICARIRCLQTVTWRLVRIYTIYTTTRVCKSLIIRSRGVTHLETNLLGLAIISVIVL